MSTNRGIIIPVGYSKLYDQKKTYTSFHTQMNTSINQHQKAKTLRDLHHIPGSFIVPNPWDIGSARILASLGFKALATTSTGLAHSLGIADGSVSRSDVLSHCRQIVDATTLPVTADLENGYSNNPNDMAEIIQLASQSGVVGGSIEDYSNDPYSPIVDFTLAVEKIQAATESKKYLPHDFILTARSENFVWGINNLDDTIKRLSAFEAAGADVLYAPGIQDISTIVEICSALSKPVNVVIETKGSHFSIQDLKNAGVKRISVGSALFLTAYGALIQGAHEIIHHGSFHFAENMVDFSRLEQIFNAFKTN